MTLEDFILKWDRLFRYDYWWRQKYGIAFNSGSHREANQIDIAMEFFEERASVKMLDKIKDSKEKSKRYKETGQWMHIDEKKQKELFDQIDISEFN